MGLLAKINSANLIFAGFVFGASSAEAPMNLKTETEFSKEFEKVEILEKEEIIQKDILLEAMIQVESRGKEGSVGDKHLGRPSIGVLQIRPIMVKEVNRILKKQGIKKKYFLDEMFYIWKEFYHEEDSDEVIARCWNGGPRGWKKEATIHYWKKVQMEMELLTVGRSM